MLKVIGLGFLSFSLLTAGVVASSGCVVVDVKPADGPRIIVPVPLAAARAFLAFAPEDVSHVEMPELAEYSELARDVLDALRDAPDGVLVEVQSRDDQVLVEKLGDELVIDVMSGEDDVLVHLPLEAAADVLASYDGHDLDTSRVLGALARVSRGDLVHVKTRDEEVKVWIW